MLKNYCMDCETEMSSVICVWHCTGGHIQCKKARKGNKNIVIEKEVVKLLGEDMSMYIWKSKINYRSI